MAIQGVNFTKNAQLLSVQYEHGTFDSLSSAVQPVPRLKINTADHLAWHTPDPSVFTMLWPKILQKLSTSSWIAVSVVSLLAVQRNAVIIARRMVLGMGNPSNVMIAIPASI